MGVYVVFFLNLQTASIGVEKNDRDICIIECIKGASFILCEVLVICVPSSGAIEVFLALHDRGEDEILPTTV